VIAVSAAVRGAGPFVDQTLLEKMVTLQTFNVSVSLASFMLAALVDAGQQREEIARRYRAASMAMTAKTDAIDVAAHELGPPVAVITSYLAILSDGEALKVARDTLGTSCLIHSIWRPALPGRLSDMPVMLPPG